MRILLEIQSVCFYHSFDELSDVTHSLFDVIPTEIKIGEVVVFPAFGGTKMTIDGEEFIVMKEQDLLATLEK